MHDIVKLNILQFAIVYILLIVVLLIMKKAKVKQSKLLIIASVRMTVQLVLAGLILTAIFAHPSPIFVVIYIAIMCAFAINRALSRIKGMNKKFKIVTAFSLVISGVSVLIFFVCATLRVDIFNPRYTIPLGGMIIGNSMTGITIGASYFFESIKVGRSRMDMLLNLGVHPKKILLPYVNKSIEMALLPTLNSMLGMGIIALPGMMTGQILAGINPLTAILYQISIMIAITTAVCLSIFLTLYLGYKTLYNDKSQFLM